jgi:hypothetical protein
VVDLCLLSVPPADYSYEYEKVTLRSRDCSCVCVLAFVDGVEKLWSSHARPAASPATCRPHPLQYNYPSRQFLARHGLRPKNALRTLRDYRQRYACYRRASAAGCRAAGPLRLDVVELSSFTPLPRAGPTPPCRSCTAACP